MPAGSYRATADWGMVLMASEPLTLGAARAGLLWLRPHGSEADGPPHPA